MKSLKGIGVVKGYFKVSLNELIFVLLMSLIPAGLLYLVDAFFVPLIVLIVSIVLFVCFLSFSVFITKRAWLFFFVFGLFTIFVRDFGVVSWRRVVVFVLAGMVFELVYYFGSKLDDNLQVFLSSVVSMLSLVLISSLFLSLKVAVEFPMKLINLVILVGLLSVVMSAVNLFIWRIVMGRKKFMKNLIKFSASLERLS